MSTDLPFEHATGYLLARLGSLAGRSWHGMLQRAGLTPHQHGVLLTLRAAGELGQQALSERIAVDPRNLVPIIDSLQDKGFLTRTVDPADRRRRLVELTNAGRTAADGLATAAAEIERAFLAGLSTAERDSLNRLLVTLHSTVTGPAAGQPRGRRG